MTSQSGQLPVAALHSPNAPSTYLTVFADSPVTPLPLRPDTLDCLSATVLFPSASQLIVVQYCDRGRDFRQHSGCGADGRTTGAYTRNEREN